MSDNKLPEGIRYFEKHANAPDFVIDSLVITIDDFNAFVEQNPDLLTEYNGKKQLKLQRLRSKQGKMYLSVDTFQPQAQQQAAPINNSLPGEEPELLPF
jgi:hypothetical protein